MLQLKNINTIYYYVNILITIMSDLSNFIIFIKNLINSCNFYKIIIIFWKFKHSNIFKYMQEIYIHLDKISL